MGSGRERHPTPSRKEGRDPNACRKINQQQVPLAGKRCARCYCRLIPPAHMPRGRENADEERQRAPKTLAACPIVHVGMQPPDQQHRHLNGRRGEQPCRPQRHRPSQPQCNSACCLLSVMRSHSYCCTVQTRKPTKEAPSAPHIRNISNVCITTSQNWCLIDCPHAWPFLPLNPPGRRLLAPGRQAGSCRKFAAS